MIQSVSASEYYVSPDGNDSNSGINELLSWNTLSYASQHLKAGDTLYVRGGNYYTPLSFRYNGTEDKPIKVIAYNGLPIIDMNKSGNAIQFTNNEWIFIDGLNANNTIHSINIASSNNITISNGKFSNSNANNIHIGRYSDWIRVENCFIENSGYNGITIYGNRGVDNLVSPGNGIPNRHIYITKNTIVDSYRHNSIDLYGTLHNCIIDSNIIVNSSYRGIYFHDQYDVQSKIMISNNSISGVLDGIIFETDVKDSVISENNIFNVLRSGINCAHSIDNVSVERNYIDIPILNNGEVIALTGVNNTCIDNTLISKKIYRFNSGNIGNKVIDAKDSHYSIKNQWGAVSDVEYSNNKVFSATGLSPVYFPLKSSVTVPSTNSLSIVSYPIYIKPSRGHLEKINVNNFDSSTNVYSFSIESSNLPDNPTEIVIITPEFSDNVITMYVNGVAYENKKADSKGLVRFYYNAKWDSLKTFNFTVDDNNAIPKTYVPEIVSSFPAYTTGIANIGDTVNFNVTTEPEVTTSTWYVNGAVVKTGSLSFSKTWDTIGVHTVMFEGSNNESSATRTWTVSVSETPASKLTITPSSAVVSPGKPFTIDINIDPAVPMNSAQFNVQYASTKAVASGAAAGSMFTGDDVLFNAGTVDNAVGVVKGIYGKKYASTISVPGTAATVAMQAGSDTGMMDLALDNVRITNENAVSLPYTAQAASVLVDTQPELGLLDARSVVELGTLTFTVPAYDADGNTLTYAIAALPAGASFDTQTGMFTWTPQRGQAGTYTVGFSVSDGYLNDSGSMAIEVQLAAPANSLPVISSFKPLNGTTYKEGRTIAIAVQATDADASQKLTYSIRIDGIEKSNTASYTWVTDYSSAGEHVIEVTVSDGIDRVTSKRTITVLDVRPRSEVPSVNKDKN